MKLRKTTALAALVTGAMAMGSGTVHAAPAEQAEKPIEYSVRMIDKTVVATLQGGTFSLAEKKLPTEGAEIADQAAETETVQVVSINDSQGDPVLTLPLEFAAAGTSIPVESTVSHQDTLLRITPVIPADFDATKTKPLVAQPIASPSENQMAQNAFASNFGIATAIGGFVGTAIGAAIGCVLTLPVLCIPGLVTGAGVGGILGTIVVGGPTLALAGVELLNTLQAEPGTTKWAKEQQEQAKRLAEAKKELAKEPK